MSYCRKCGSQLDDGAKFCASCGTSVEDDGMSTSRKQVFAGEVIKCPNCGSVLESMQAVCPDCGFELNASKKSESMAEFRAGLEKYHQQLNDIIKNTRNEDILDTAEEEVTKQITSYVSSFAIPNTIADVTEFMMLVSQNANYTDGSSSEIELEEAWFRKSEQVYQKAKLSFGTSSKFKDIERMYNLLSEKKKKTAWKKHKNTIILLPIMILLIIGSVVFYSADEGKKQKEKNRLETVYQSILDDIKAGEYDDAEDKCGELYPNTSILHESHEWKEKREKLEARIKTVKEKNKEKGAQ